MVCNDTHCDIYLLLLVFSFSILTCRCGKSVFLSAKILYFFDDWLEYISIIVTVLALKHTYKPFKSHTGIDNMHCQ